MSKFRVGDRVRVISSWSDYFNEVFKVGEATPDWTCLDVEHGGGRSVPFKAEELKLEEPAPEPIGKQLKTIDAKIVNGFLVKDSERAIRIKNIFDITIDGLNGFILLYISDEEYIRITTIGNPSLEDIILELGVNL